MSRIIAASLLIAAANSQAAVTVQFNQVGNDVVATATGSFDSMTGLAVISLNNSHGAGQQAVASVGPFLAMGPAVGSWTSMAYTGSFSGGSWTSPLNLGTSSTDYFSSSTETGNVDFWISKHAIYVSTSYVFGTQVNNVSTWNNTSFAGLGLEEGTYTWTWAGDSFSINVGTPVPEPSTYGLILGGLALVGAAVSRRRAKK